MSWDKPPTSGIGPSSPLEGGTPVQQQQQQSTPVDEGLNKAAESSGLTKTVSTSAAVRVKNPVRPGGGTALDDMPKFIGSGGIFKYFDVTYTAPKALQEISGKSGQVQPGTKQHVALQKQLQNTAKTINSKYEKLHATIEERKSTTDRLTKAGVTATKAAEAQLSTRDKVRKEFLSKLDTRNKAREDLEEISKRTGVFQKSEDKGKARDKLSTAQADFAKSESVFKKEDKALDASMKAKESALNELQDWQRSPEAKGIRGLEQDLERLGRLGDACQKLADELRVTVPKHSDSGG